MGGRRRAGGGGKAAAGDRERRECAEDGPFQHGLFSCHDAPPREPVHNRIVTALLRAGSHLKRIVSAASLCTIPQQSGQARSTSTPGRAFPSSHSKNAPPA